MEAHPYEGAGMIGRGVVGNAPYDEEANESAGRDPQWQDQKRLWKNKTKNVILAL